MPIEDARDERAAAARQGRARRSGTSEVHRRDFYPASLSPSAEPWNEEPSPHFMEHGLTQGNLMSRYRASLSVLLARKGRAGASNFSLRA